MHADEVAVGGQPDVALQGVGTVLDRLAVGGQGVFGGIVGGPAMGDDLDRGVRVALPCVGHPRHGVTATGVGEHMSPWRSVLSDVKIGVRMHRSCLQWPDALWEKLTADTCTADFLPNADWMPSGTEE